MVAGADAGAAGASIGGDSVCADSSGQGLEGGIVLSWLTVPSTRTLVITVLVVGGVALAALGAWAWYDAGQRRVAAAYADVSARVQAAEAPDAPAEAKAAVARELQALLTRYPSARPVPQAAFDLGNLRMATRDYIGARAAYQLALQRGATGMLRTLAQLGIGRAWESERDFAKAADAYAALVNQLDNRSFAYEDALVDYARTLELSGKKDEAVAAYQKVLKEVPNARRADDIRARLAALGTAAR
jgi:tetratricopeptide (TPR) repeat protein